MVAGQGQLSSYTDGLLMTMLLGKSLYLALAASDPFAGDPLTAEVIGGSYGRVLLNFVSGSPTSIQATNEIDFHGLALGTTIFGLMVFDASRNGNMIAGFSYDAPVELSNGGKYTVAAGEVELGVDVAVI